MRLPDSLIEKLKSAASQLKSAQEYIAKSVADGKLGSPDSPLAPMHPVVVFGWAEVRWSLIGQNQNEAAHFAVILLTSLKAAKVELAQSDIDLIRWLFGVRLESYKPLESPKMLGDLVLGTDHGNTLGLADAAGITSTDGAYGKINRLTPLTAHNIAAAFFMLKLIHKIGCDPIGIVTHNLPTLTEEKQSMGFGNLWKGGEDPVTHLPIPDYKPRRRCGWARGMCVTPTNRATGRRYPTPFDEETTKAIAGAYDFIIDNVSQLPGDGDEGPRRSDHKPGARPQN